MKKFLLLMLSLVMVTTASAEDVTPKQALEQARNFIQKRENSGNRPKKMPGTAAARLVEAEQVHGLYVFNVARDEGFVIVSNDDRTEPILGYSDTGNFDPENIPENMKAWLKGYADQIAWLNEHPEEENVIQKAPTKNAILPLISAQWNQGDPYNQQCPTDPLNNRKCVTGCVATAMAQVMHYYRWPTATSATIPAYVAGTRGIQVDAIPSGTSFDWNNMLNVYNNSADAAAKNAVAKLMKACGAAVKMDYTSGMSSTNVSASDLITYFNYSETARNVSRSNYTFAEWNTLVYGELVEGRPVLYSAQSSGGGHQFVIDGYDGDELFHVNWGWGGHQDGYFLLSILNPGSTAGIGASSTSDGYSFSQNAIIGIKPYDGEIADDKDVRLSSTIVAISNNTTISSSYWNLTGEQYSFDLNIGYVANDGSVVQAGATQTESSFRPNTGWDTRNFSVSAARMANGTYRIVPISRVTGTSTWKTNVSPKSQYVEVVVSNRKIQSMRLCPALSVQSFSFTGNKKKGVELSADVSIRCSGGEFYGPLYLFANTTSSSKGSYKGRVGVTLVQDKVLNTRIAFTPTAAGTHYVWIATDVSGINVIGQTTVVIDDNNIQTGITTDNVDMVFTPEWSVLSSDKNYILGVPFRLKLTIYNPTANTYKSDHTNSDGEIRVTQWDKKTGAGLSWRVRGATIEPYSSAILNIDFSDIVVGGTYAFQVQYTKNGQLVDYGNYHSKTYTVSEGIFVYDKNGAMSAVPASATYTIPSGTAAVDLRGNKTTKTVSWAGTRNPNCLFVLDAGATVPAGANSNVVKGGVAENITLQDGYDFYSPATFIAQNITYTRTFNTGLTRDYRNWTTITLPFDVSRVTVDLRSQGSAYSAYPAYPIDWFRNAGDTKKNFWVMEFDSENNGFVNFSHASEIRAARPLLIAVPGAEWGSDNDLTGLPITFRGTNAAVSGDFRAATSGDNYKMKGVVAQKNLSNAYVLNNDGNAFTRQSSSSVDAFRAYFEPMSTAANAQMLTMAFGNDEVTALEGIFTEEATPAAGDGSIYDLQGRKMNREALPKGIYIVNGKKMIVK